MLSGNGRHRRPRQAPALLVAAGVTGSVIAIPLLGATGASAADGTTWDQVADCESGGSWSADTGNGRYGGLQLTQENWNDYGGLDYATTADQASRSQQIAVAEKVLADQGVGVWSTCGLLHNLGGDSGSADVDTGVTDDSTNSRDSSSSSDSSGSSKSSGSADGGDSSGSSGSSGSGNSNDSAKSGDSDDSAEPGTSSDSPSEDFDGSAKAETGTGSDGSTDSESTESDKSPQSDSSSVAEGGEDGEDGEGGTGRHRGASADESAGAEAGAGEGAADDSRATDSAPSGRHASRGGDTAREGADGAYTVQVGDSLTGIVNSLGLDGGWRGLYAENRDTVGTDPDLILPGQTLEVGAETGEK
ncbi:LysM peptidoglycan-binding domain-containing protein [Streptomyces phaeolivaceus]|uniref:LysM peptidoglycan-binding domain-containing protein n=1 Tax=Streptomyces phaeolivaceus TaxID=2653200 RepID=A0A5P8KJ32_9ACTN|nr:transglycosylase family protein [Streptomyces phaeolivaceus]QFR02648.1 LysM peptidoglycan-binding domain-containing protein [Streptomyces phaeolivaceus]